MDVRGVGSGPSSFQPVAQEPTPARAKPEGKPIPFELLGDRRLGAELESMGLSPEPGRLMAARALIVALGQLDPKLLAELEHALSALEHPTDAAAKAGATLLAKGIPATPQAIAWMTGRHGASDHAGARLVSLLQRLAGAAGADPHRQEVLNLINRLALPEGKGSEVASALKGLVEALKLPEADLGQVARKEMPSITEDSPERLISLLQRWSSDSPAAKAAHDEVRATQLQNGQETVLPVWWPDGSGEIRVQEHPEGGKKRSGEGSGGSRVVLSLETPHLKAVRVDLLLSQGQVNCHVAVQDPEVAEFLSGRLDELRTALEAIGIRPNSLEVKTATKSTQPSVERAQGVDFYG